MNIFIYILHFH